MIFGDFATINADACTVPIDGGRRRRNYDFLQVDLVA